MVISSFHEVKVYLGGTDSMELEERLSKIEAIIAEDAKIERLERKGLRIAKFLLLVIALSAPVVWALFEFVLFLINRYQTLLHSLDR